MIKSKRIHFILGVVNLLLIGSCSSLQQINFTKDRNLKISLGQVVHKEGTLHTNIEIKGVPENLERLELAIKQEELSGNAAAKYQSWFENDPATDGKASTVIPYLEIEIINDIELAQMINEDRTLKSYVQQSKKVGVITHLKATVNQSIPQNSTAVYLEKESNEYYAITFYGGKELIGKIEFSELMVFDYQVSFFCYGIDNRNQISVIDLVEDGKSCKRPLKRKIKNLLDTKRLIDY